MSQAIIKRCSWAKTDLLIPYHDEEWGVPVHDDRVLFEFLTLEGAQAGLSWETVLKKRDNYRLAFDDFDPVKIAKYDQRRIARLLNNPGIIRNRLKLNSTVENAKCFLRIQKELGSFDSFVSGISSAANQNETSGEARARFLHPRSSQT